MVEHLVEPLEETLATTPELEAWMQLTYLILAALSGPAVSDAETDADPFLRRIQESSTILKGRPSPAQVLIVAGSLSQAIANYTSQPQRRIDSLLAEVRSLQERVALAPAATGVEGLDGVTPFPNRAQAEAAIGRAVASGSRVYVAAFYVHRTTLANVRFGRVIGDQVISFCGQHLTASIIKPHDSLYRWTGPAYVAILQQDSHLKVTEEVQRAASKPVSRVFETASRTVYLPIKLTGEVVATANQSCAEVTDQIERFILEASGAIAGG
jgi:GGDEF domain-containing protein